MQVEVGISTSVRNKRCTGRAALAGRCTPTVRLSTVIWKFEIATFAVIVTFIHISPYNVEASLVAAISEERMKNRFVGAFSFGFRSPSAMCKNV